MNSMKITGAILLLAVCVGSAAAQDCGYIKYTNGENDFYGNDLTSIPKSDEAGCIAACEANPDCYAIVLKDQGTCYLKDSNYAADIQPVANTVLSVDMSCLHTDASPSPADGSSPSPADGSSPSPADGSSPSPDDGTGTDSPPTTGTFTTDPTSGLITTSSTAEIEGGEYVTTEITYDPLNYNADTADDTTTKATAVQFYSDDAGMQLLEAQTLPNPTVTSVDNTITATSADNGLTTSLMTDATTGEPMADSIMTTGGVTLGESPSPTTDTPLGTPGTITTDAATNQTTMMNTVEVPNTEPVDYVTITTVVDATTGTVITKEALYTDAKGVPVDGKDAINEDLITVAFDPAAVYPAGIVTTSVDVMDKDGATQTLNQNAVVNPDGTLEAYAYNSVEEAAGPSPTVEPPVAVSPPPTTVLFTPPPPPSTVPITTKETGASSLPVFSAVLAVSVLGALMM